MPEIRGNALSYTAPYRRRDTVDHQSIHHPHLHPYDVAASIAPCMHGNEALPRQGPLPRIVQQKEKKKKMFKLKGKVSPCASVSKRHTRLIAGSVAP